MKGYEVLAAALGTSSDACYAIPGYPVTELAAQARAEPAGGEKIALEYALGDSLSGRRAAVIMKNVGLNACADPLVQATTQGLVGGVVIVAGDDPGADASTSNLDSRYYGELAQVPVLEPDQETCARSVEAAFAASEEFSRIAILRVTPDLLFSRAVPGEITGNRGKGALADPSLTMKGKAARAESLVPAMFAWSRDSKLNRITGGVAGVGAAAGDSRIVTVYPPPAGIAACSEVREIGRPFVAGHRTLVPPGPAPVPETVEQRGFYRTFCQGCPFLPLYGILRERGIPAIADAGCSILAMNPPYRVAVASYGLGSAIGVAARSTHVALIGDYALLHSGLQSLVDVYEKGLPLLTIVIENRVMGMTGGQEAPAPGRYIGWANPWPVSASDIPRLRELLFVPDEPVTIIVRGTCPEGRHHETVEC